MISQKAVLVRNSLVQESLVDMADRDYLAARVCWRTRLPEQFLWSALQALEKQFKAILLLNGRSAKGLGHNLEKALKRLAEITDLRLDPPEDVRKFVTYLNRHGPNRYVERPFYLHGSELFDLDKAFWWFRRYCQNFRAMAKRVGKSEDEWLAKHEVWFKNEDHLRRPYRFRLFIGYLEAVLDGKHGQEQYKALVWKNLFFGRRDKGRIEYRPLTWIANPAHVRHPDVFKELASIVDFPVDVRRAMTQGSAASSVGAT